MLVQMLLKDAAPREGGAFNYSYDMTDPWIHTVDVVSITNQSDLTTKLIDGKRAGLPEVRTTPQLFAQQLALPCQAYYLKLSFSSSKSCETPTWTFLCDELWWGGGGGF